MFGKEETEKKKGKQYSIHSRMEAVCFYAKFCFIIAAGENPPSAYLLPATRVGLDLRCLLR